MSIPAPYRLLPIFLLVLSCAQGADRYHVRQQAGDQQRVVLVDEEGGAEATIAPQAGGELCSFRFKFNGERVELIYRACDYTEQAGWQGKAPILWPATGATFGDKDGSYSVAGKTYTSMPSHGFARNMPWKVDWVQADKLGARAFLSLTDTEQTRRNYPFGWRLSVEYRLRQGRLFLIYTVGSSIQNTGNMPFSIGNHVTFRTPFVKGSDPLQMKLETAAGGMLKKDSRNFPTGELVEAPFKGVTLLAALTAGKVISLGGFKGDPELVLTDPQGLRVRIKHTAQRMPSQPFVQFNLWGDPKGGYFCPEPWVGGQNSLHTRLGLLELKPGDAWRWTIEFAPGVSALM